MLAMAVYELIHACGLTDSDHSRNDAFFGLPSVSTDPSPSGNCTYGGPGKHAADNIARDGEDNSVDLVGAAGQDTTPC